MPLNIFGPRPTRIQEIGILIKYDTEHFNPTDINDLSNKSYDLECLNFNDCQHILVIRNNGKVKRLFVSLSFNEDNSNYILEEIDEVAEEKYRELFSKCPHINKSSLIIIKGISEKIRAVEAEDYTYELAKEISNLDNCQSIIEEEKRKEEERKKTEEQLELWKLSIEAQIALLVDTPFNCIGIESLHGNSVDLKIDEYVFSDDQELIIEKIRTILGGKEIDFNDSGKIDLNFDDLSILEESDEISIKNISKCTFSIDCDESYMANNFRKSHRIYGLSYEFNWEHSEATFTFSPRTVKEIKTILDEAQDYFSNVIIEREVKCYDVNLCVFRKESRAERDHRLELLKDKEFIMNEGKRDEITIGTLKFRGSSYSQLRIAFPTEEKEKQKINTFFKNIQDKGINFFNVKPNLIMDRCIYEREKDAIKKVQNGRNLKNPNLKSFIFNSARATPTTLFDDVNLKNTEQYEDCRKTKLLNLNESQQEAIVKAVYAKDLCLLQGPPGTGKTTVIAELIWQHIRKNQKARIMLTSQANLAIDNALSRLLGEFVTSSESDMQRYRTLIKPLRIVDKEKIKENKLSEEGMRFTSSRIESWMNNGEEADNVVYDWLNNIANRIRTDENSDYTEVLDEWKSDLKMPNKDLRNIFGSAYLNNFNIMGMTCGKVDSRDFENNRGAEGFDIVIMDEASKCTPPELLMPLCYGKKMIIIGDHRQLPPVIYEADFRANLMSLNNERARELAQRLEKDMVETCLFKKLITNKNLSPTIKATFKEQYRMHPHINAVIEQFYKEDGGLKCGLNSRQVNVPNLYINESRHHGINIPGIIDYSVHTLWIDVHDGNESRDGGETSLYNQKEVNVIDNLLDILRENLGFQQYISHWKNCGNSEKSLIEGQIGLISFYASQVKRLQSIAQSKKAKFQMMIKAEAVDNFQGQERGIVIVSTVRTKGTGGFTRTPERLNVALSRARRLLIVVGNSDYYYNVKDYNGNYIYRNVIDQIKLLGNFIKSEKLDNID